MDTSQRANHDESAHSLTSAARRGQKVISLVHEFELFFRRLVSSLFAIDEDDIDDNNNTHTANAHTHTFVTIG